jgi:predicted ester cyclase
MSGLEMVQQLESAEGHSPFAGVGMLRFAHGKVVERWTIADSMTLLHQLGLV